MDGEQCAVQSRALHRVPNCGHRDQDEELVHITGYFPSSNIFLLFLTTVDKLPGPFPQDPCAVGVS